MKTLMLLSTLALSMALSGCYMNPPPQDGRNAPPPEEQPAGEAEQPQGEGDEGEVPPPAPGTDEGYGEGQPNVPVDPGPTW